MTDIGAVTLDDIASGLPLPGGNGLIEIQPGFFLARTDLPLGEGIIHSSESFPFAGLSLLLEGCVTTDVPQLRTIDPNALLVVSQNERRLLSSHLHGASRLRNVEVFVTPSWFEAPGNRLANDPGFEEIRIAMQRPLRQRRKPMDQRHRDLAMSVLRPAGGGAIAALRIEAHALELLAELASSFVDESATQSLSPRDRDRMLAVREAIEADPASVVSLASLATRYGVSASKLKRDFFLAFSSCVGGYVNEQRLGRARRLIEDGMSVSQAAYSVGYAHPTNFATAFKRRFGVAPRTVRG